MPYRCVHSITGVKVTLQASRWVPSDMCTLSAPLNMIDMNARSAPSRIILFKFGLDIFMYL